MGHPNVLDVHSIDEIITDEKDEKTGQFITEQIINFEKSGPSLKSWMTLHSTYKKNAFVSQTQVIILRNVITGLKFLLDNDMPHGHLSENCVKFSRSETLGGFKLPVKISFDLDDVRNIEEYNNTGQSTRQAIQEDLYCLGHIFSRFCDLDMDTQKYSHRLVENANEIIEKLINEKYESIQDVQMILRHPQDNVGLGMVKTLSFLRDPEGSFLFEDLEFTDCLGSGSFGSVLSAIEEIGPQKRQVAVKIVWNRGQNKNSSKGKGGKKECKILREFLNIYWFMMGERENLVKLHDFQTHQISIADIKKLRKNLDEEVYKRMLDLSTFSGFIDVTYLKMELCGPSLRTWLDDNCGKPPDDKDIIMKQLKIIRDLISAVTYLHKSRGPEINTTDISEKDNSFKKQFELEFQFPEDSINCIDGSRIPKRILHRDIRPENIFLSLSQTDFTVKLGDYGLGHLLRTNSNIAGPSDRKSDKDGTSLTRGEGTPLYMAPEVLYPGGESNYGTQADIFSLGLVFWEVVQLIKKDDRQRLFYEMVYEGKNEWIKNWPVASNMKEIIVKMTKKSCADRLADLTKVVLENVNIYPKSGRMLESMLSILGPGSVVNLANSILYSGNFVISQDNVTIIGEGIETILEPNNEGDTVVYISGRNCKVSNLKINAPRHFTGIKITSWNEDTRAIIENVKLESDYNFNDLLSEEIQKRERSEWLWPLIMLSGSGNVLRNVTFQNSKTALEISHCSDNLLEGITILDCVHGMDVTGGASFELRDSELNNAAYGIKIYGGGDIVLKNVSIKKNQDVCKEKAFGLYLKRRGGQMISDSIRCEGYLEKEGEFALKSYYSISKTSKCSFKNSNFFGLVYLGRKCRRHTFENVFATKFEVKGSYHKFKNCNATLFLQRNCNIKLTDNQFRPIIKDVEDNGGEDSDVSDKMVYKPPVHEYDEDSSEVGY